MFYMLQLFISQYLFLLLCAVHTGGGSLSSISANRTHGARLSRAIRSPEFLETSRLYLANQRNRHDRQIERFSDSAPSNRSYLNPSDWYCHSTHRWKDLGASHFPRFVKEVACVGTTCFDHYYRCQPVYYEMSVLTSRQEGSSGNIPVPMQLRSMWKFTTVNVPVACQCVAP